MPFRTIPWQQHRTHTSGVVTSNVVDLEARHIDFETGIAVGILCCLHINHVDETLCQRRRHVLAVVDIA